MIIELMEEIMGDSESKIDHNLFQLALSLQMAAMQNLGKILSPVTGKIERNLEQARISIDMLAMIADKTKGNLNKEEDRFLRTVLHELRLNYMDEAGKPEPTTETKDDDKADNKENKAESSSDKANEGTA
jgi:hypothetical protein